MGKRGLKAAVYGTDFFITRISRFSQKRQAPVVQRPDNFSWHLLKYENKLLMLKVTPCLLNDAFLLTRNIGLQMLKFFSVKFIM